MEKVLKIENEEQNEKFAKKVLKNKEKITLVQEVLKNNQVKDKKEVGNKIQYLNSYIVSLQRLLSFIKKPAVINLISFVIIQLKLQVLNYCRLLIRLLKMEYLNKMLIFIH